MWFLYKIICAFYTAGSTNFQILTFFRLEKITESSTLIIRYGFKGTVVNRALSSLHCKTLEITLTVPSRLFTSGLKAPVWFMCWAGVWWFRPGWWCPGCPGTWSTWPGTPRVWPGRLGLECPGTIKLVGWPTDPAA